MPELPTGTLTFVFTDIVGSTRLWEEHPDAMSRSHRRHSELVAECVSRHQGILVRPRGEGDSTFSVFRRPPDAVGAVCDLQRALQAEPWPTEAPMRVRAAVHTGVGEPDGYDYNSSDVNRCARLRGIAHGGQTLLSRTTAELVFDALPGGASLRDLGLHRLKDLTRPERVYQLNHPDLPAQFPPLASLNAFPNNLPQQLTSFVGREAEMAEVRALLEGTRALTIAGAGGLGKTRLSLQVAALDMDDYPDGVWVIELAPLRDGSLVERTLAGVLGIREAPGQTVLNAVISFLRDKSVLLVLDNCEHLIDASARLAADILSATRGVRILATTREPLRIPGETVWRLSPLKVPAASRVQAYRRSWQSEAADRQSPMRGRGAAPSSPGPTALSALSACDSVRLFVDRARSAQPRFALTPRNAAVIADICRRIDGIPLAIELAAARVPSLGVERIAERLDDRFRLLTRGIRTALRRQQTLQALIEWSYDLLGEEERKVFRRLAVFAGGWDQDAARAVVADRPDGEGAEASRSQSRSSRSIDRRVDVLLDRLVDKSLVTADERPDGTLRYRMLETIRQYAWKRLAEANEAEAILARHIRHYRSLAEEAEPLLIGARQAEWFDRLELEHDNVRAALAFGAYGEWGMERRGQRKPAEPEPGTTRQALRLAAALWRFWLIRGHISEGAEWLTELLTRDRGREADVTFARALHAQGRLAGCQGDYESATDLLQESLATQRRLGDDRGACASLLSLGVVAGERGDMDAARGFFEQSLALQRAMGDRRASAVSLQNLGNVAVFAGDLPRARELFEESLSVCRELGDTQGTAIALNNLGHVCARLEDYHTARQCFQDSLAMSRELGYKVGIASCTDELAKLAVAQQDAGRASRLFAAAISIREEVNTPVPQADQAEYDRMLAEVRKELGDEEFETSWAAGRAMTLDQAVGYALTGSEPDPADPESTRG